MCHDSCHAMLCYAMLCYAMLCYVQIPARGPPFPRRAPNMADLEVSRAHRCRPEHDTVCRELAAMCDLRCHIAKIAPYEHNNAPATWVAARSGTVKLESSWLPEGAQIAPREPKFPGTLFPPLSAGTGSGGTALSTRELPIFLACAHLHRESDHA